MAYILMVDKVDGRRPTLLSELMTEGRVNNDSLSRMQIHLTIIIHPFVFCSLLKHRESEIKESILHTRFWTI
jgi:hypothetical protein